MIATYELISSASGSHIHGFRFLRLSSKFVAIGPCPLNIVSISDIHSLLGRVLEEQTGLNELDFEETRVKLTLPLDLDPEPKQHQLLYAKSPFHFVDCLLFELRSVSAILFARLFVSFRQIK
jgi:hypothetical protein